MEKLHFIAWEKKVRPFQQADKGGLVKSCPSHLPPTPACRAGSCGLPRRPRASALCSPGLVRIPSGKGPSSDLGSFKQSNVGAVDTASEKVTQEGLCVMCP